MLYPLIYTTLIQVHYCYTYSYSNIRPLYLYSKNVFLRVYRLPRRTHCESFGHFVYFWAAPRPPGQLHHVRVRHPGRTARPANGAGVRVECTGVGDCRPDVVGAPRATFDRGGTAFDRRTLSVRIPSMAPTCARRLVKVVRHVRMHVRRCRR